jgi:hypothetical protein
MSDKFAGRASMAANKSFAEILNDLELAWRKQDDQLAFDHLMNRMKRGLVAVEEINRIPKRWRQIAFERGYIKLDDTGNWIPRKISANQYTTPWQDQRHVSDRAKKRMKLRELLGAAA